VQDDEQRLPLLGGRQPQRRLLGAVLGRRDADVLDLRDLRPPRGQVVVAGLLEVLGADRRGEAGDLERCGPPTRGVGLR